MAVADCYEAMRSPRSYKDGIDHGTALLWLVENAGRYFDPEIVDAFASRADTIDRQWSRAFLTLPEPSAARSVVPSASAYPPHPTPQRWPGAANSLGA